MATFGAALRRAGATVVHERLARVSGDAASPAS